MKIDLNTENYVYKKINYKNKKQNYHQTPLYNNNLYNNYYPLNYYSNFISFKGESAIDYDSENIKLQEEKLTESLVKPALRNSDSTPSAFLLYSEDEKKSAALIDKISAKMNARVIELDTKENDYTKNVYNLLRNSRENYLENKQRTLIVVKNSDLLLSDSKGNYGNITKMKSWLDDCAKIPKGDIQNFYASTFILQTDKPENISPVLLNKEGFGGVVNVQLSGIKDIENLINNSIENNENAKGIEPLEKEELAKIVQNLSPNKKTGGFSDNKIKSITDKAVIEWKSQNGDSFAEILNKKINSARKDISPRVVTRMFESRKWLVKNGWIEMPELKNIDFEILNKIMANCDEPFFDKAFENELSQVVSENNDFIKNASKYDIETLKDATIGDKKLVDLWLNISQDNIINKENSRLKNMWFVEVLSDKDKTNELISKTLDILQKENRAIETARKAYCDIIENDETITQEQKTILIQQQENKMFFDVVMHGLNPNSIIQIEDNVLSILDLLSKEKEKVSTNAKENIFEPAKDVMILSSEDSDDVAIVNYIFQLISKAALNGNIEEKNDLKLIIESFNSAKETANMEQLALDWKKLLVISQDYFNSTELDNLTHKNIELLNSINNKKENISDKSILKILNNPSLTIEQKEFIARYADNSYFRAMIKNPNVDINQIIETLVFFEADNKNLIQKANLFVSDEEFQKIMDDKFKEINRNAKDINIQGNKITSKLDEINSSINAQSDVISQFAEGFAQYAQSSLFLQASQLNELAKANKLLSSINLNTKEISAYTKTLTRAKLIELEKDKYFKEIVPELVNLLPENEQVDIKEFLLKVDELAKKEKNAIRKKKIIKAAAIIAGTITAGAAVYYFGPAVVAHLLSQTANPITAASAITSCAATSSLARRLGNSSLINFEGENKDLAEKIHKAEMELRHNKKMFEKYPESLEYSGKVDKYKNELKSLKKQLDKLTK